MKLSQNEQAVYDFIKSLELSFYSPTYIAKKMFPKSGRHSAWASPVCLRLVEKGLLIRNNRGWYALPNVND